MQSGTSSQIPAGWEGILDPGEQILWQGRPLPRFDWIQMLSRDAAIGLATALFALFWISQAYTMTRGNPVSPLFGILFPLFGLPILFGGLAKLIGAPLRSYLRLRGSHYTLTDRNAFIATQVLGKRGLERFPLGPGLSPALEDGMPGSVWFAHRTAPRSGWLGKGAAGSYGDGAAERVGFQSIPDARQVFRQLLDAQSAIAATALPPLPSATTSA